MPHPGTNLTKSRDMAVEAAGGVDAIYPLVAAGLSMTEVAKEIGLDGTAREGEALRQLLRRDETRWGEARRDSADAISEKADTYGDEAPVTSADAKWRNDRSGYFRWLTEFRADLLGQPGVQINIGLEHLQALKEANARHRPPVATVDAEEVGEVTRERALGDLPG